MAVEITEEFVWQSIPPRARDSHKGTFGSVLAVAGSAFYRGAALLAASPPANAARAAGRARSRQDACTVDGCAVGSAKCNANAFALHARRHGSSHRMDTPDGTMQCTSACSESAAIMGVNPARPGAPRRSRRMR